MRRLDLLLLAGAVDDGGVLLGDRHPLGLAEHGEGDVLELDAEVFGDDLTAGQDRDVLQHRLAAIAEARRLDGRDLEAAAELVDDERGQRLALDVLGDDQQRPGRLDDGFEHRQHRLEVGELLLVQEDERILELGHHLLGVGDEVGREVAAVELHALDDFELELERLGLLDGDDALVADLLHGLGDLLADDLLAVGGDRADLGDLFGGLDLLRALAEVDDRLGDGHVDAALEVHRVHAGGNRLGAVADDRLGENGGGGGAVAGDVVGLRSDFADHLGAHVLELVLKLDFLGDGDAVLGDARGAERLVEDDVAALGAERDLHRVGEDVDAAQHLVARVGREFYVFGSHCCLSFELIEMVAEVNLTSGGLAGRDLAFDDAHDVGFLHDQKVFAVDLDLGARPLAEQDAVADLDVERDELARFVAAAGADGDDLAFLRLLLGGVGNDDAAGGLLLGLRPGERPRGRAEDGISWGFSSSSSCTGPSFGPVEGLLALSYGECQARRRAM